MSPKVNIYRDLFNSPIVMSRYYDDDDDDFDYDSDEFFDDEEEERGWLHHEQEATYSNEHRMYTAVLNKNISTIKELLEKGIDINLKLENGWTTLMLAAFYGDLELTKELIALGANVNYCGDKYSILMAACSCNNPKIPPDILVEIVRTLIENGADVNAVNSKRMNALMCASYTGHFELVKMLLPLSKKDSTDYLGWTALFWAISNRQIEITKLLIEEGFSLNIKDVRCNTPYDLALTQDCDELLSLFPSSDKNQIYLYQDSYKTFEEIFADRDNRPKFFSDICNILLGVNSENIVKKFADADYDLSKFLCVNEDKLVELGIQLPFQRHRILAGLHKLHIHPYKPKATINICQKKSCSTFDVSFAILSCIKQVIVMEASMKYILPHLSTNMNQMSKKDLQNFRNRVLILRKKTFALKKSVTVLNTLVKEWDESIAPPDLIVRNSIRRNRRKISCKLVTFLALSLVVTFCIKYR